jgi:hypothetical protein
VLGRSHSPKGLELSRLSMKISMEMLACQGSQTHSLLNLQLSESVSCYL